MARIEVAAASTFVTVYRRAMANETGGGMRRCWLWRRQFEPAALQVDPGTLFGELVVDSGVGERRITAGRLGTGQLAGNRPPAGPASPRLSTPPRFRPCGRHNTPAGRQTTPAVPASVPAVARSLQESGRPGTWSSRRPESRSRPVRVRGPPALAGLAATRNRRR